MHRCVPFLAWAVVVATPVTAADPPAAQRHTFTARASEIDPRARPQTKIGFILEKDGKPQDVEHASVDPRVPLQGKLVIWLMGRAGLEIPLHPSG